MKKNQRLKILCQGPFNIFEFKFIFETALAPYSEPRMKNNEGPNFMTLTL
jgi:hypothetical protein